MVISNVTNGKRACQVEQCGSTILAKGFCCKHYYQMKRNGAIGVHIHRGAARISSGNGSTSRLSSFLDHLEPSGRRCSVGGCGLALFDQQLCRLHFIKMRYLGMVGANVAEPAERPERYSPWDLVEEQAEA